jgi:N-acyl-D-amino-acid deacylase
MYDTLIRQVTILDGSGAPAIAGDVALQDGRIAAIGDLRGQAARETIEGAGRTLAPGFIDVHTHDDTSVIRTPEMLPKLSQGVTTVIVGNCGISAAPVKLRGGGAPPEPLTLLGAADAFVYPTFAAYANAVDEARPAVNVAALIGHTALRSNHLDRLDRAATADEVAAMRAQLGDALRAGAIGLSTGLAYASAFAAPTEEVIGLAEELRASGALYTTHLRSEFAEVLDAMDEAFTIGRAAQAPVVVSHLKCAGAANWGRSPQLLDSLERAAEVQEVACDCYPYSASSSLLDLKQVTDEFDILITWSEPYPAAGGRLLAEIAGEWQVTLMEAATRLRPAGAVYHGMSEDDVRRILTHPRSMIGSDGLPHDPHPHPRLWGTFPRVLGHYSRDLGLLPLAEAVRKMTGLSAARFQLTDRGLVRTGYWADLVLFDAATIRDAGTYDNPIQTSKGIDAVWVNGILTYRAAGATGARAGRLLRRVTAAS